MGYDIGLCKVRRGLDYDGPEDGDDLWIGRGRELDTLRDVLVRHAYRKVDGYDPSERYADMEVPLDAVFLRKLVALRRQLLDCEDFVTWVQLSEVCDDAFVDRWMHEIGIDREAAMHVAFRRTDDTQEVARELHDICFDYAYGLGSVMSFLDAVASRLDPAELEDGVVWLWVSY